MANEINLQATLSYARGGNTVQPVGSFAVPTQTGSKAIVSQVTVATGANSTLQIDGSAQFAYIFAKNLDAAAWSQSNYINVALDNAAPPVQVVAKLRAGEFCLIPVKEAAALYARASGTPADLLFVAVQG